MRNPLDAPRTVWCRVCVADVERIDRLVKQVNHRATWFHDVKRTEVLRALVRTGLGLAKTRSFVIEYLEEAEAKHLRFKLSPEEFARVTDHQSTYVKGLSNAAEPPLASVQRALIQLGLSEAEQKARFSVFMEEVKASLWPRSPSRRSERDAAEAPPEESHAPDAGHAASEVAQLESMRHS